MQSLKVSAACRTQELRERPQLAAITLSSPPHEGDVPRSFPFFCDAALACVMGVTPGQGAAQTPSAMRTSVGLSGGTGYGYAVQKTVPYSGNLEACGVSVDGCVMCKGLPWVCGRTLPAGANGLGRASSRTGMCTPEGLFCSWVAGPSSPAGWGGGGLPTAHFRGARRADPNSTAQLVRLRASAGPGCVGVPPQHAGA